jgi:hypothetical protein
VAILTTSSSNCGSPSTESRVVYFAGYKKIIDRYQVAEIEKAADDLGEPEIPLTSVDRLIVIGSDGMMRAVQQARHSVLRPYLKPDHQAIGSINSPMQCMLKEVVLSVCNAQRPGDWQGNGCVLMLQPGSTAGSR